MGILTGWLQSAKLHISHTFRFFTIRVDRCKGPFTQEDNDALLSVFFVVGNKKRNGLHGCQ